MTSHIELAIALDRDAPGSIATKLVLALRQAIEHGGITPGDLLPPTRLLAERLGVSRGTVVAAYEQLVAEGYFTAGQGRGTRVNPEVAQLHGRAMHPAAKPVQNPLPPPTPRGERALEDLSSRSAWRTAWRRAAASPKLGTQLPAQGDWELLGEIAEHLRTMRGTVRDASDILVTAGAREGLALMLTALGTTRGRRLNVGVESGGPDTLGRLALRHGAQVVTLEADSDGLIVSDLPHALLDLVIVTPSYQYPQGQTMPLDRRQALLAWAMRSGVVIVEDDYDSELRYLHAPLPTLAALDDPLNGVVATLGSFSSTLSLSLAAGFLVLPRNLRDIVLPVRNELGNPVSPVLQFALTELLADGELRRHVARLRRARARASAEVGTPIVPE